MLPDLAVLPHTEESERAVLGAILLGAQRDDDGDDGPNPILTGLEALREEDFYLRRNSLIFSAMRQIDAGNLPIDLRTLQDHLGPDLMDEVGGIAYLVQLDLDLPDVSRVEVYAAQIREAAARRRAIQSAGELIRAALEEPRAGADGKVQGRAFAARIEEHQGRLAAVAAGLPGLPSRWRSVADVEARTNPLRPATERELRETVKTGIGGCDRAGLLGRGELDLFVARPGTGKTALALQIAAHVAIDQGLPVGFVSIEMNDGELLFRLLAQRARVNYSAIRHRGLNLYERPEVEDAMAKIRNAPLYFDDRATQSVTSIGAAVRRLLRDHPDLALIMVDYVALMELPGERGEARNVRLGKISKFFVNLARTTGISCGLVAQLKRYESGAAVRKPTLESLAESDQLGQDAVAVTAIHREPKKDAPNRLEEDGLLVCLKNRNDDQFEVPVRFRGEFQTFVEIGG